MKEIKQTIGTYLALPFIYGISLLPHFILYGISDFFFVLLYYLIGYRNKVIYNNLCNSFPDKSHKEIKKIQRRFYRNLTDIIIETIKEFTISEKAIKKRFKFKNPELFDYYYKNNKSVMMLMGHYNNWEYGVSTQLWVRHKCWAVYAKLKNKSLNKQIVNIREKFGFKLYPMEETYEVMLDHKQGDKLYMFMADQSPHHSKIKYWINFLNQETGVHLGAEKLSKMLNTVVIFIDIQKVKRGYYEVTAKTLFEEPQKTKEHEITDKYFEVLENIIKQKPEYWLWSHKRWKYKKHIEY